jgi:hypothetical protein
MSKKIIKTKFFCKTSATFSKSDDFSFIEGKWYDGEYEYWSDQLYKLNGGWRRYWIVNEQGKKFEISRTFIKSIFETDLVKLRDAKINEIIK